MHMDMHQQHDQQEKQRQQTITGRMGMVVALVTIGTLVSAVASFGATATPTVHAARAAPAQLAAAVTEGAKVILPETSIAGPSFHGEIAWTGTDAAHHLNVRIGTGGLAFPTKITLAETSPFAPAVTILPSEGGVIHFALAWTGTDAAHSLNVAELVSSSGSTTVSSKRTLHETSIAAPAIFFTNGNQWLAWTGTDANHSLNVLQLASGQKTVLSQFSSNAGPSLAGITADNFVLGWSVRGTQRLNLATSTDGVIFTSALGSGLPQLSATAPQVAEQTNSQGQKEPCIAWTGTDAAHHLNVQCTTSFPQFPDPAQTKTVLGETALGAPGFVGVGRGNGVIAWTGTDAAHHLNVAELSFP